MLGIARPLGSQESVDDRAHVNLVGVVELAKFRYQDPFIHRRALRDSLHRRRRRHLGGASHMGDIHPATRQLETGLDLAGRSVVHLLLLRDELTEVDGRQSRPVTELPPGILTEQSQQIFPAP